MKNLIKLSKFVFILVICFSSNLYSEHNKEHQKYDKEEKEVFRPSGKPQKFDKENYMENKKACKAGDEDACNKLGKKVKKDLKPEKDEEHSDGDKEAKKDSEDSKKH